MDDKIVINILVELAGLEEELVAARGLQERNLAREESMGELQEEYRQDENQAAKTGLETEVRFRNREGEMLQLEKQLADRRRRLAGLGDPRQVEALEKEIVLLSQRLDSLETRALELLDEAGDTSREAETARLETIRQEDNYGREAAAYLPLIQVSGTVNPVVQVIDESSKEVVYTLRIKGREFRPKVFKDGTYTVVVRSARGHEKVLESIKAVAGKQGGSIKVEL